MGGDNGGVLDAHAARICADAVAIPILRRAAVGGDGAAGNAHVFICVDAVAFPILRRAAGGGDIGCAEDGHVIFCVDAVAVAICLAAVGLNFAAGDAHAAICADAVAVATVAICRAAGGLNFAAGDVHAADSCEDAVAYAIGAFCRAAGGGDNGGAGDGHVIFCPDAAAYATVAFCRAAGGSDGAAGNAHAAGRYEDAAAGLACTCRIAAGHIERTGALDGQAVHSVNTKAILRRGAAGDGIGRTFRQNDCRVFRQHHRGCGGGGKIHALEGEGLGIRIPCAVRCAGFRGVEQSQCCGRVGRKVRLFRCRLRRQCHGWQHAYYHHKSEQDAP